ncbi:coxsackievirus and adenovirus receptor homolog [Oreochromis aureus]|uniref:coxsackievirus and adenovirus receptor homolog n=1 Tax=Oreochromis aureus TaxID=47969 RepID=UPI001952C432|nr:coxsackievirus and adenovirus receptor homolog [Oreochromis aureus]CAI5660178.1 unnamed protein product [Mustela putorius furo]
MAAGTCASVYSTLLLAVVFVFVSADQKNITVQSGQNVRLPCQAPNDKGSIRAVAWTKPAQIKTQNKNVYFYRDGRVDPEEQHPSFKNRVDLQDRQMKNGDVSLILNNVTINDAGTYECSVTQKKELNPYTTTITLDLDVIHSRGQTGGHTEDGSIGLIVGLSVSGLLLLAVVFFIHRRGKQQPSQVSYQPPAGK